MVRPRSRAVASDMQAIPCRRRGSVAVVCRYGPAQEALRGVPPGRETDEREDAGAQEGVRGGRIQGREDGALEWKRGLQRTRGAASSARAQGRGGDEEEPRKRFRHHRAPDRSASQDPRLRSLRRIPTEARREARGHVPAPRAQSPHQAAARARRRPHPAHPGRRGIQRLCPGPARAGVHDAHREDVRQGRHHAHLGYRHEGGEARPDLVSRGMDRVLVAGAGVFGVTAAIELRKRGHPVMLVDPGPLPHPLAASTDISKVVRLEYGADEPYTALAERAIEGWRRWNQDLGPLYHETGLLLLRRTPLAPGTFEQDSFEMVSRRGHRPELVDGAAVRTRFPAWNAEQYRHGTYDPEGGFVESGKAMARLIAEAGRLGVELREGVAFASLVDRGVGIISSPGEAIEADRVVLALGSWTPRALPWLAAEFRSTGHPVFHLAPRELDAFRPERFPVFCAEIQNTGYYGFPAHPESGVVKIARHGKGRPMHPESPQRSVTAEETAQLREFLAGTFPLLQEAPIVHTRICLYCDSSDGHFWIARDPDRPGAVVASGYSAPP